MGDIVSSAFKKGYGRGLEYQADASALRNMAAAGYNPRGLDDMLMEMNKRFKPEGPGFGTSHPPPDKRIDKIADAILGYGPVVSPKERQARFEKAMAGV